MLDPTRGIDAVVARQLQLGSAVIIPIYSSGALTGALAVFSRHPRAFDEFHIRRLERLAAVVTGALQTPQPRLRKRNLSLELAPSPPDLIPAQPHHR